MDQDVYPYDTAAVSELLKHKRRTRGITSCFPCRHRKVRCDGRVPCSSCLKRGHGELCRAPSSSAQRQGNSSTTQISALKKDLRAMTVAPSSSPDVTPTLASGGALGDGRVPIRSQSKFSGRHVVEDATGATIFLGSHSDTPLALGCREASASGDTMFHGGSIDHFVPRAYPFTSLWGPEASAKDVCETLPDESDMIRYWQAYQSTAYPFYPVLVNIDTFGFLLFEFLNQQASIQDRGRVGEPAEPDPSWLALLFAVLACGAQFTHDLAKERDLRSKVFICSSFHCLRLSNFFNHTNMDQIQAMALIGHCLRNNLDTNSAWILMGTTIRLAQSIGLHETSTSLSPEEQVQRSRLWWTLVWQDTFLSFTYDRPPSCFTTKNCPIPLATVSGLSFQECIFRICQIIIEQGQLEDSGSSTASKSKASLEGLWEAAAPFLTTKAHCRSLQDHLERLALGIHLNYAICRVGQLPHSATSGPSNAVIADCRRRAMQVVEHFLELHRFSKTVCRSWAFVHNAVSCAITMHSLSHVPLNTLTDPNALAQRLLTVLESEARESEWYDADTNVRYFGPYSRALKALKEIYGGNN
ncbi:Zn(II)2Cys6 transcription factor [Aspergillus undulatus]|uniref:Zn(II)2Cys6 transcription factor n=1 Tax=Aspergillus undulatus TaxID=1810928 RepID=UPI003CCCEE48